VLIVVDSIFNNILCGYCSGVDNGSGSGLVNKSSTHMFEAMAMEIEQLLAQVFCSCLLQLLILCSTAFASPTSRTCFCFSLLAFQVGRVRKKHASLKSTWLASHWLIFYCMNEVVGGTAAPVNIAS